MRTASITTVLICVAIGVMIGKSVRDDVIAGPPKQSVSNWDVGELIDADVQVDEDSVIEDFATKSELSALESRVISLEEAVTKLKEKPAAVAVAPPVKTYSQSSYGSNGGGSSGSVSSKVYSQVVTPAAVPKSAPVVSSSNYVPRFTYPGTIESHMATEHGVSPVGLSASQLLAQHDAIHDVIGPTSSRSTVRQSFSNCPGGVCPVPSSTPQRSFRIFRR